MAACATTTATTSTTTVATTSNPVAAPTTTTVESTTTGPSPATTAVVPSLPTTELTVGEDTLQVWVADEPEERQQGLRAVAELPDGIDGMLFVFPEPTTTNFIMSGTLIPLEVWFFDLEGLLIGSHEMTPCSVDPCPLYPAPGPVRWALETPLAARDFQPGDLLST
ncbi:MAG: DUF192 domain-containing protein, partial [Acidimicrobiia bacterium]